MKMKLIAKLLLLPAFIASGMALASNQTDSELKARIETLEARVARMEAMFGPALQTPEQQAEQMKQHQDAHEKEEKAFLAQVLAAKKRARKANKWLNPEPWTKLRVGMPRQEVEQILGKPSSTTMVGTNGLHADYHAAGTQEIARVSYSHGRLATFVSPKF